MSTYETAYCSESDLQSIVPNIADYDRKRTITGWSTYSGSTYQSGSSGAIDQCYRDGLELTSVADRSTLQSNANDGEYFYDSSADVLYVYSTNAPGTSHVMEGGKDWATIATEAINRASELVASIIGKPIYQKKGVGYQSQSTRNYDEIIILSTAGLACALLVRPYDQELADTIEGKYNNEVEGGILQHIRMGNIKLHHEIGKSETEGVLREVSINASSTGSIADLKGLATADDLIKVIISTAGTFTAGSASTVKYDSYIGDSTGLKISKIVDGEIIDGSYQYIGHGLYARFTPGIFTLNDEYEVECSAQMPETHNTKFAQAIR